MGTSVNQRSPDTPNWKIVQKVYENKNLSLDRALKEIWRATGNSRECDLGRQLENNTIALIAQIAENSKAPAEVAKKVTELISREKSSSLATDIAKRAAMQSVGKENTKQFFVQRLFSEVTNYIVSRDLPGYISNTGKLQTVRQGATFKKELSELAGYKVSTLVLPNSFSSNEWSDFIRKSITSIRATK